jgi:hypothetical protein
VGGSASVGHPHVWGWVGNEEDHVGPGGVAGGRMWVEVAVGAFQNFCEVSDTTGAGGKNQTVIRNNTFIG